MSAAARALALAVLLCLGAAPAARAAAMLFSQAIAVAEDADSFAGARGVPQPQRLPDDWAVSRPGYEGAVWYRVSFDAPPGADPREVLALYVERVCTNLEVQLNGRPVYSGGSMQEPVARNCYHPQLVPLPAALLRPLDNRLDIKVRGHALGHVASRHRAAGLSALQIGPLQELAPVWRAAHFRTVTAVQLVAVTMLVLGVFMVGVGWLNRRASYLMYFGVLAIGWAVLTSRIWLAELPFANATPLTEEFHARIASSGFEQWFRNEQGPSGGPSVWKMDMIVLLLLYPIVFLWGVWVGTPILQDKLNTPWAVNLFIGNIFSVLLTGFMVPWVANRMGWWIFPKVNKLQANLLGAALICAIYAASILVFWRFF